jgi:hypothetical protein
LWRDERCVLSRQGIEKAALAHVGKAQERHSRLVGRCSAACDLPRHTLDLAPRGLKLDEQIAARNELNIFFDEIESRLQVSEQIQQSLAQRIKRLGQTARELTQSDVQLALIGGVDHASTASA